MNSIVHGERRNTKDRGIEGKKLKGKKETEGRRGALRSRRRSESAPLFVEVNQLWHRTQLLSVPRWSYE